MNKLQQLLSKFLPTQSRRLRHIDQEPPVRAHMLDVDELHSAFRAAEAGDTEKLFGLYRDMIGSHAHLQGEFGKRKLAVIGDPLSISPQDPDDKDQEALCEMVKAHLEALPGWLHTLGHILDSTLYPISLTERLYKPSDKPGWNYEIKALEQVPHHHICWPEGKLSFRVINEAGHFTGQTEPIDEDKYILHRGNLLTSLPDWHGGPMRAVMFWWLFSVCSRDWWGRFLERFGSPFIEGKYDSNDDSTRFELQDAFQAAQRLFAVVVSNEAEIKLHQANTQGGSEAFESFHSVANREISKIVIGQTLSAEGQNLGLGGGQGKAQSQVRDDIRQFDAVMLAHTIKTQILAPLWRANGWTTPLPNVSFGADSVEEQQVTGDILNSLSTAGLQITDEGISIIGKKIGIPVERISAAPLPFAALSATSPEFDTAPLIPVVARRAARKRQARRATEAMLSAASPQLARIMKNDFSKFEDAIAQSSSPEDALERIATLTAEYDHSEASTLFNQVLTSASVNALLASDH